MLEEHKDTSKESHLPEQQNNTVERKQIFNSFHYLFKKCKFREGAMFLCLIQGYIFDCTSRFLLLEEQNQCKNE